MRNIPYKGEQMKTFLDMVASLVVGTIAAIILTVVGVAIVVGAHYVLNYLTVLFPPHGGVIFLFFVLVAVTTAISYKLCFKGKT